jgi:hypothetical protein
MKRSLNLAVLMLAGALLAGCGTFIRSNVTAFHAWPAQLPAQTYVFERTQAQNASLEYRSYENLVRAELNRLGLVEAGPNVTPYLKVSFQTDIRVRDVREVYPVVIHPYGYGSAWGAYPFHGPRFGTGFGTRFGTGFGSYYGPFYDPFWYGPPVVQQREANYQLYTRELRLKIARFADGQPLYEATAVSEGEKSSLAAVMPYLVRSLFKDFPGPSGVTRQIELKME